MTSVLATYHKDFGGRVHVEKRVRPHCTTLWVTANCSGACKLPVSADSNRARIDHAVVYQILCVSKKLLHSATVYATGFRIGSAELCQRHCYTSMLSASSNSLATESQHAGSAAARRESRRMHAAMHAQPMDGPLPVSHTRIPVGTVH